MQRRTRNRLVAILGIIFTIGTGIYMILSNLQDNIVFFYAPTEVERLAGDLHTRPKIRVGGLVATNSIRRISDAKIEFVITDNVTQLTIEFTGALPALFREGQGIVAEGQLTAGKRFLAQRLLIKHDENYMPPEVAKILKPSADR